MRAATLRSRCLVMRGCVGQACAQVTPDFDKKRSRSIKEGAIALVRLIPLAAPKDVVYRSR